MCFLQARKTYLGTYGFHKRIKRSIPTKKSVSINNKKMKHWRRKHVYFAKCADNYTKMIMTIYSVLPGGILLLLT